MTRSIEAKLLSVLVASLLALTSYAIVASTVPITVHATTGMSNCTEDPTSEDCNPQPDRVGNDHDEDDEVTRDGPDEGSDEANCWGKVTSDVTHDDDGDGPDTGLEPGEFGQHAANPTGDADNDTPREGVGNQDEDHPSDHADTVGPRFGSDEDCTNN
jgi:hypothetical protein